MSSSPDLELQAFADLVGGAVAGSATIDRADRATAKLVADFRGQLNEALAAEGIGVRGLARKLSISGSAVSRQLRAEGDIRASTAALFADALNRDWVVTLKERVKADTVSNGCGVAAVDQLKIPAIPSTAGTATVSVFNTWVGSDTLSTPGSGVSVYTVGGHKKS
jgi:hypothetical protein